MKIQPYIFTFVIIVSVFRSSFAQVPRYITHQGFLTRGTGEPYDTTINIRLDLSTDSANQTNVYNQTINSVVVTKGIFNVTMGPINKPFDQQYWLTVTAGAQVLSPSIKLTSAAYALRADTAVVAKSVETVAARYTGGSTAFGGSAVILNFSTKDYDTHNAYSNGVFTCPVAGIYQVTAAVSQNAQFQSATEVRTIYVYKNGSDYCDINDTWGEGRTIAPYFVCSVATVKCIAGDQLAVYGSNNNGSQAMNNAFTTCWVTFTKVGN